MSYMQGFHIADGFADDCDELMHRCLSAGTLTFEIFSEIWKDMHLSSIYQGRNSGAELAELSEEVLHIAKHYMVADTSNFEESVAGLFLVYSLINLQPYAGFASLRIVQEDIPAIERIELVARRDRRQDVLYVLGSVLIQGPVQYHAVPRERGMEFPIRKYLEASYDSINKIGVRPKGVFYRQNTELDIIREIKNLTVRYKTAKENIPGVPRDDRNLNYLDTNFASQLDSSLKKIINGIIDEGKQEGDEEIDAIKNLKDKAMKGKVKPIRHLVGVGDNESERPPKRKNEDTSPTNTSSNDKRPRNSRRSEDGNQSDKDSDIATADELLSEDELDLSRFNKKINLDNVPDLEFDALNPFRNSQSCQIEIIDKMAQPSTSGDNLSDGEVETADTHKRDLKKTILKSRFKRMGMLPVANFGSTDLDSL